MHCADKLFDYFRNEGYNYFIIPKGSRSKVYFTKADQTESLFSDPFKDDDMFDEFKMENEFEKSVFRVFPRNTFINIRS